MENLDPSESWIDYKNKFQIIEQSNGVRIPTVEVSSIDKLTSSNSDLQKTEKTNKGFSILGDASQLSSNAPYQYDVIQSRGNPQYFARMVGYALRVGFAIPTPILLAANEKTCYRVGNNNKWSHEQVAISDESSCLYGYVGYHICD